MRSARAGDTLTAACVTCMLIPCSAFFTPSSLPRPIHTWHSADRGLSSCPRPPSTPSSFHRAKLQTCPSGLGLLSFPTKLRLKTGSAVTRMLAQQAPSFGQDLKEMFEVYKAPAVPVEQFSGEPEPAGFTKQRTKVHRDGDWHRAVHIWLYTSDGNLVLQQRSEGKDTFPGKWDCSVGGHVTAGDSVMETAVKEVQEELGVDIRESDLELLGTIATSIEGSSPAQGSFTCNEFKDVFLLRYDGAVSELNYGEDEVQAVALRHWREVKAALDSQVGEDGEQLDGAFIPRPRHYMDLLFAAIEARIA